MAALPERITVPVAGQSATYHARYECKYLIDQAAAQQVRRFIQPFTQPDGHAARSPGYRYAVNSLYLDSQDLVLYAQTVAGENARFKLRVRTYSDDPASPAFFEIKKKINTVVCKRRAALSREHARDLLERGSLAFLDDLPAKLQEDLQFFQHYARTTAARPVARVKYMREAYEARSNEPVRVTFDTDLMHAVTTNGNLSHSDGDWVETPTHGVILEIKYTERLPSWAQNLVRMLHLSRRGVPKYVLSIDHILRRRGATPLTIAGRSFTPRRV